MHHMKNANNNIAERESVSNSPSAEAAGMITTIALLLLITITLCDL